MEKTALEEEEEKEEELIQLLVEVTNLHVREKDKTQRSLFHCTFDIL